MQQASPRRLVAANLLLALAYAAAAPLVFAFGLPPAYVSPVYPPSGIAVAALLILGPRLLPGVWLGNALSSTVLVSGPLSLTALAVTLNGGFAAAAEAFVAGWAMRSLAGARHPFDRPRDVVVFLLGASLLAGAVGGALGTLGVWAGGFVATIEVWHTAAIWMLGDAAGIAIFAPLILAWHRGGDRLERGGLLRSVPAILAGVLTVAAVELGSGLAVHYLYLPVILWAGFRSGPRGATLATALVGVVTVLMTAQRRGGFAGSSTTDALLLLEGFIAVITSTGLIVCAVRARQAAAEASLAEHNRTLEARVAERTAELRATNHELANKQRRIDADLDAAHALQAGILPSDFTALASTRIAAAARPALEMSGDFYDVFLTAPGRQGIAIADVAGKGVAAAFFMAVARTLVRLAPTGSSPAARIALVNDELCRDNPLTMFVTLFYAELNEASGELTCVNAGHCPPVLLDRAGQATPLRTLGGPALGILPGLAFKEERIVLAPGEGLFLYTDGVTEATDAAGGFFGEDRLLRQLQAHAGQSPEALLAGVLTSLDAFAAGAVQADDVTCLTLRRSEPPTSPAPPGEAG